MPAGTESAARTRSLIGLAAVIILVIAVVVFLLLQKPKQVTPVAVLGTSPSASAAAPPRRRFAATVAPTQADRHRSRQHPGSRTSTRRTRSRATARVDVYPHMTWAVVNATGISISIDTPGGLYDSYGTSGATDQQNDMVPFSCSATPLQHTYFFTTTGGTGPAVTKKVTVTGTP